MRCLVTGGAGFIGSHIVEALVGAGHSVRVFDDLSTGSLGNLEGVAHDIQMQEGDLCSMSETIRACEGIETIFHQGAMPSVPKSIQHPVKTNSVNVVGTVHLLEAARVCGCRRVIYAASSSAYGNSETLPKVETQTPKPISPYAVQKLAGEYYMRAYCECYGIETVSLRYFNVFGPKQNPKSQYAAAIPAFIRSILTGTSPIIYGDGEQTRDFTFIKNVVHANMLAMVTPRLSGETVNVACGTAISLNSIIECIGTLCASSIKATHVAERAGDVRHSLADISLAKTLFGYKPVVDFQSGLAETVAWYQAHS